MNEGRVERALIEAVTLEERVNRPALSVMELVRIAVAA